MKSPHRYSPAAYGLLFLFFSLLLTFSPSITPTALAQSAESPWVIYREEMGLASNNISAILSTNGEIWFGTENGISRFNGQWTSWKGTAAFVDGMVGALAIENIDNTVWAGTDQGYVAHLRGDKWTTLVQLSSAVQALHSVDGQMWLGTAQGLFIWNGTDAVAVDAIGDRSVQSLSSHANTVWVGTDDGIWLYQRQSWAHITAEDGLPGSNVTAIWLDPSGPVWVGTTEGLTRRHPMTGTWQEMRTENVEGKPFHIQALTGDENGDVWGGTDGDGAFQIIEGNYLIPFSGDVGLPPRHVQAVAVDLDGSVWFGTTAGVFRYDQSMWVKEFREPVQFPGINHVTSLLIDDDDRLWIATLGAGIRLKQQSSRPSLLELEDIYTTLETNNLVDDYVSSLVQDNQGNIWAGTRRGIARYDPQQDLWVEPFSADRLPSASVNVLAVDHSHLWIGTGAGLAQYSPEQETLVSIEALAGKNIQSLAVDSLRRLWVGTLQSGVFVQQEGESSEWKQFIADPSQDNSISGNAVVALSADPGGGMWVAINRQGLNYWRDGQWLDYTVQARLPSNLLYTLYVDPVDSSLWIGSEGGLTRYDGRTWESFSVEDLLSMASIFAVVRAPNGSYWFGSRDGLTFYNPEETPPWIRVSTISGTYTRLTDDMIQFQTDQQIGIRILAGDLHTAANKLAILYRISGPGQIGEWIPVGGDFFQLPEFEQDGKYFLELLARDQAFNYSEPARLGLDVVLPPATVELPFLTPMRQDTFIALLITGIVALIGFGYMSMEIIQSRRRTREALIRGYNPFVSGEPVRRQDMFFGRHDLLQRIIDTLHNNSIMIHGERRIGKTTLLYQLAGRLREVDDSEYWFVALYIDLEGTTEDIFFHFLLEEILNGVMTLPAARERLKPELQELLYYSLPTAEYTDREFSRDLRDVIRALQDYSEATHRGKQLRLILLLDEMDVMSNYNRLVQQRLRRIFMRDFAATLGAVVAGIQISKDWDRVESPWYNLFNEIELEPFSREQALELLVEPIQEYYRYDPAALEFIIDKSGGRPFRLQQYALEAVNQMLGAGRRMITLDDVEYAHEHIQRLGNDVDTGLGMAGDMDMTGGKLEGSSFVEASQDRPAIG